MKKMKMKRERKTFFKLQLDYPPKLVIMNRLLVNANMKLIYFMVEKVLSVLWQKKQSWLREAEQQHKFHYFFIYSKTMIKTCSVIANSLITCHQHLPSFQSFSQSCMSSSLCASTRVYQRVKRLLKMKRKLERKLSLLSFSMSDCMCP